MDPNQTWRDLIIAFRENDHDRVDELASALIDWLQKGGFPPTIASGVDQETQHYFVRQLCESLLSRFTPTENRP